MHRTYWIALAIAVVLPQQAGAVSEKVRKSCRDDYMTHCNTFEVGSAELKQCMRKAGRKLSRSCVDALVEAGEISRKEVEQRRASGQ
jgi:adenylate kinase